MNGTSDSDCMSCGGEGRGQEGSERERIGGKGREGKGREGEGRGGERGEGRGLEYMYSVGEQLQPTHNSPNASLHPYMGTCMLAAATSQPHRRS